MEESKVDLKAQLLEELEPLTIYRPSSFASKTSQPIGEADRKRHFLEGAERILKNESYLSDVQCRQLPSYGLLWIEYAGVVKDSKVVYAYIDSQGLCQGDPSFWISHALYYEKFERDFKRAGSLYLQGITSTRELPSQQDIILAKFGEFAVRMQKRTQRDVISLLEHEEKPIYNETIRNKKRKFEEVFPQQAEELLSGTSSRKKRILNELREG